MSENRTEVIRPEGALDEVSVRRVGLALSAAAIDCSLWTPVYHEGVRELIRQLLLLDRPVILFNLSAPLSLQLGLLGVAVSDGSAIFNRIDAADQFVTICPGCRKQIRLGRGGEFKCPSCGERIITKGGIIIG